MRVTWGSASRWTRYVAVAEPPAVRSTGCAAGVPQERPAVRGGAGCPARPGAAGCGRRAAGPPRATRTARHL